MRSNLVPEFSDAPLPISRPVDLRAQSSTELVFTDAHQGARLLAYVALNMAAAQRPPVYEYVSVPGQGGIYGQRPRAWSEFAWAASSKQAGEVEPDVDLGRIWAKPTRKSLGMLEVPKPKMAAQPMPKPAKGPKKAAQAGVPLEPVTGEGTLYGEPRERDGTPIAGKPAADEVAPVTAPPDVKPATKRRLGGMGVAAAASVWAATKWRHTREYFSDPKEGNRRVATAVVIGLGAVATGVALYLAFRGHGPPPSGGGGGKHHPTPSPTAPLPPPVAPKPPTAELVHLTLPYHNASPWSAVVEYANSQGITLSEPEKTEVVGKTLQLNHLSWADAHYLPVGFKFKFDPSLLDEYR